MTARRTKMIRLTGRARFFLRATALLCGIFLTASLPVGAAQAEPPKASAAATNSLPANADAAWKEIETASRPPAPPAEWAGKTPTPEQREAFRKTLGEKSALVAAKAKEFYTRFPDHAKAEDAKRREQRFLEQAAAFGNATVAATAIEQLPEDRQLEQKINAVHRRALGKRAEGTVAVAKEMEAGIRELIKEYPDKPVLWQQMFFIAQNMLTKEEKKRLLTEIVSSKVADEETIARAKAAIKIAGALGQPLDISFTATDGRKVDIQKMKGKVVLIDFWAAWCGPCIAALPEVVQLYNQYHDQGFEIVGINLDKLQPHMEQVVHRFKMPWPQYFDGKGWGNKFALEYNINSIPSLWLVDKKGILRSMEAGQDLEGKIKELLAEKD
jgi:thiol-disulfide isomerase/thioredoxin